MKNFLYLLLAVGVLCTACGTSRRVPVETAARPSWVGSSTKDILDRMGDPTRIDPDGKGGSILVYESEPDYSDPKYDILDPEAAAGSRQFAHFYLDSEGVCYKVETNRDLLSAPRSTYVSDDDFTWLDTLLTLSLLLFLFL